MKDPVLGKSATGDVRVNVERLIETRAVIMANSGGGKSWLLRRLLEQTHGSVQQIVIDVEDEFATLREKYDYVLAGRQGGDCPADVRCAELLARRLLELRVSAIIGIYELKAHERVRFVRLFLESLVNAPKDLWHPVLVVVDEAQLFAPEGTKCESTQAVIDLMNRGRKRGFCGVLATQRPSMLSKDASAAANNKLIGRFSQDIDVKRAADDLGIYKKERQSDLRRLKPGSFFAVGPALCDNVTEIEVGPVETTHPRAGQRAMAPPPPAAKVLKILATLEDLPHEAEQEAQTMADLQRKVRELERAAKSAPVPVPAEPTVIDKPVLKEGELERIESVVAMFESVTSRLDEIISGAREAGKPVADALKLFKAPAPTAPRLNRLSAPQAKPAISRPVQAKPSHQQHATTNGHLPGPEQRILDAIAWLESLGIETPEQTAVAFLAGYTTGGGGYNNPRGSLRTKGYIDYVPGDKLRLTEPGREQSNYPDTVLTNEELQRRVMDRLPGPEKKILRVILDAYPEAISNEACATASGYTEGGGGYNNPRGRLRTLGLIEYVSGGLRARDILFPA